MVSVVKATSPAKEDLFFTINWASGAYSISGPNLMSGETFMGNYPLQTYSSASFTPPVPVENYLFMAAPILPGFRMNFMGLKPTNMNNLFTPPGTFEAIGNGL